MIKEKQKISKYTYKKSKSKIIFEYFRTLFFSLLLGVIITTGLTLHARQEILNDIYAHPQEQDKIAKEEALKIINENNYLKDIKGKNFATCLHVGDLYMSAEDYYDAQITYEIAVNKSPQNNYKAHYKLILALIEQEKFNNAYALLNNVKDVPQKQLIKFKTRAYLVIGDKYYSVSKFLSAVKNYEKALFYYSKFKKQDKVIVKSLTERIVRSYIQTADLMVKAGRNSEAVRFLKKAEEYMPDDYDVRYKLAIVLSDLDPEKSVSYFEKLFEEVPQNIDYGVYCAALMKSANIADLDGRSTKAKYYRYKIHSIDLFLNRKVVYKNDIETILESIRIKKHFFTYKVSVEYSFQNISNIDIVNLMGEFTLMNGKKNIEKVKYAVANKDNPLYIYGSEPNKIKVTFSKGFLTKKELENYVIDVYLYKDERFKTHVLQNKIVQKNEESL